MNRAICLQRPDPSIDDITLTGHNILCGTNDEATETMPMPPPALIRSTSSGSKRVSSWLVSISRAFHTIYSTQAVESQQNPSVREFIGMRDFYCLLKMLRTKIGDSEELSAPLLIYALCRNFNGKPILMDKILQTFHKVCFYGQVNDDSLSDVLGGMIPPTIQLIKDCINSPQNRHLMLLTKNSTALSLVFGCRLLREQDVCVLIGSQFKKDMEELHLIQQINDIKNAMFEGRPVVLLNHDGIYESLYDVLNQRYVTRTDPKTGSLKRMLRLAIGPRSQLCPVSDGFRIIVIVDQNHAYENLDLPLLNRFEKQVLMYDSVLPERSQSIVRELNEWIAALLHETGLSDPSHIFAGFHDETVSSLVFSLTAIYEHKLQVVDRFEMLNCAKFRLLNVALPAIALQFPYLSSMPNVYSDVKFCACLDVRTALRKELNFDGDDMSPRDDLSPDIASFCKFLCVLTHSPVGHYNPKAILPGSDDLISISEVQLSMISSEIQIHQSLKSFFSIDDKRNKLLVVLFDPCKNSMQVLSQVQYLCVKYGHDFISTVGSNLSKFLRHIVVIVNCPPAILFNQRHFSLDFQLPWRYRFVDDIRIVEADSISYIENLTQLSLFELHERKLVNVRHVVLTRYQSALSRCIQPTCDRGAEVETGFVERRIAIQGFKNLLRYDEFVEFLLQCVCECLRQISVSRHAAGFPFQVEIALNDPTVGGTLKETLFMAIESIIIQVLSHVIRSLDRNFNLYLLMPRSSSEGSFEFLQLLQLWLSMGRKLLDVQLIARSCAIVYPCNIGIVCFCSFI
jgi:hypothetical protein